MNHTIKLSLALALALPLAACNENKAAAPSTTNTSTTSMMDAAKTHLSNAPADLADATKSISDLEMKSASMSGESKSKLDSLLTSIKSKRDDIAKMISEMQTSPVGNSLDGLKTKINNALAELKKMISDAQAAAK